MDGCYDFAVIGAGPAGCAAAIELARAGARVCLLEKASFPRDKLCGEFLSPEVPAGLEELGCAASFHSASPAPIDRAAIVTLSGARFEFALPVPAFGLSRLRFDQLLADAARQAGAELVERAEIGGVATEAATARLQARDGREFRARAVLLAAGRHSLLQPIKARTPSDRLYFGFKAHYRGDCAGRVELYFFRGGYCGLAPVEAGRVNLCCLVEKRLLANQAPVEKRLLANQAPEEKRPLANQAPEELLAAVPALRARLAELGRIEPFLHTGPVALGWREPPAGMLPAGDAALFVDPFTGDGISLALQTGRLAARWAMERGPPIAEYADAYGAELRRRFDRQLRLARLLRRAAGTRWLEVPLRVLVGSGRLQRAFFRAAFIGTRNLGGLAAGAVNR